MWLDRRLRSVVNEIDGSDTTIDVGTDHGKVILTAMSEGRCRHGIASDISKDSLAKASELATLSHIDIDTRLGDGLSVVSSHEVDTAVIAGMGGKEIVKILSSVPFKVPKIILVPHKDARMTRECIVELGYKIDKDYMVKEGNFFYSIIVASIGTSPITKRELYFGKNDITSEVFREYLSYRMRVIKDILSKTQSRDLEEELSLLESY